MSKFILTVSSHSLSNFQQCESKFLYQYFINISPLSSKKVIERGTMVAKWLQLYYYNKMHPTTSRAKALINPMLWTARFEKVMKCSKEEAWETFRICQAYKMQYKDETWIPLATEKGFSKILYEDDDRMFIWEGRPDLVVQDSKTKQLIVTDHKVISRTYEMYPFNNQVRSYLWATGATQFCYNYLVATKDPKFLRSPSQFSQRQLEDWQSNAIEWCKRIENSIKRQNFEPSWQCSNVFGLCPYHLICEQPDINRKSFVIKSQFLQAEKHRSW